MSVFDEHVMPRIIRIESELALTRDLKLPHAMRMDQTERAVRLAARALELVRELEELEAMRGEPDGVVVTYLAGC